jgi:hypothetical protein
MFLIDASNRQLCKHSRNAVAFTPLQLVQIYYCRGAKMQCSRLPDLVGGVDFAKFSFSPRLYGKLTSKQAQPKWRKTDSVWLTAPPRLLSVHRDYGARAPS